MRTRLINSKTSVADLYEPLLQSALPTLVPSANQTDLAAPPAETASPGEQIGDKPVWQLPDIFDNFFRFGHWPDGEDPTTYSIPITLPSDYRDNDGNPIDEGITFTTLTAFQAEAVHYAMDVLDSFITLDFTYLGNNWNADLRFMNTIGDPGATAHADLPDGDVTDGDVWVHRNRASNLDLLDDFGNLSLLNSTAVTTLLHEIGHTMGLAHPGDYDALDDLPENYADDAVYFQDSSQYTIMSYFGAVETQPSATWEDLGRADTYMLHDVYALQREYGAEMTTRTGNTIYGFNSNAGDIYDITANTTPRYVIWDAGGYDTWDLSLSTVNVELDLSPGRFSSIGGGINNVAIAYNVSGVDAADTAIERAFGGNGNDTLSGNNADNDLFGGNGQDRLYGRNGNDSLNGGGGNDTVEGGNGNDTLRGGTGADTLYGGDGNDRIYGDDENDWLFGNDGDDTLAGGDGDDTLAGDVGLDVFYGDTGFDQVDFRYSNQDWTIQLAAGAAAGTATFGAGTEYMYRIEGVLMGGGNDTIRLAAADNGVFGGNGDDVVHASSGNHTIEGGQGTDLLSYATSAFGVQVHLFLNGPQRVVDRSGTTNDRFGTITDIENLTGTAFDDTLSGDDGDNVLNGGNGNDLLSAIAGEDLLNGGNGSDTLVSGTGDDTLNGNSGFDMLSFENATSGVQVSVTANGASLAGLGTDSWSSIEALRGSVFGDTLTGSNDVNRLEGGGGNDRLYAGGGSDTLDGGFGNDLIEADLETALAQGNDVAEGGYGDDTILGYFGDDTLRGDDGDDVLLGGSGTNQLFGGSGSDTLSGSTGNDRFDGGSDTDYVDYRGIGSRVAINLNQQYQNPLGAGADQLIDIEGVFGTYHDDILFGRGNSWSRLFGEAGDDEIQGGIGNDLLNGGSGDDTIRGGGGNDTISGGLDEDVVYFNLASAGLTINLANGAAQNTGGAGTVTISGIENLIASDHNDLIGGNSSANELFGEEGNDTLLGREGTDVLWGGLGNDTLDGGTGDDTLQGEGGSDTASYATATSGVAVSLAVIGVQFTWGAGWDRLYSIENLTGSTSDDVLTGSLYDNVLRDLQGNDMVAAGSGNDTVFAGMGGTDSYDGGTGSDVISFVEQQGAVDVDLALGTATGGGIGTDGVTAFEHVVGYTGNDTLSGAAGGNRLLGGAGDDQLFGWAGNDTLVGGVDNDTMTGGTGADRFEFGGHYGADTILDFQLGVDLIRFTYGPAAMSDLVFDQSAIFYGDSQSITLVGVEVASLSAADFLFG